MFKKCVMIVLAFSVIFTFYSCSQQGEEAAEVPQTEDVIISLARWEQQVKGEMCTLEASDLKIIQTIDKSTKEITSSPSLKGTMKILNHSDQILDIKEVSVQYLDDSWDPIPFKDGETKTEASFYGWSSIQPGEEKESSLDLEVPKAAMNKRATDIRKIRYEISYVPVPLKREVLDLAPNVG